jgi:hypothetical protein
MQNLFGKEDTSNKKNSLKETRKTFKDYKEAQAITNLE